MHPAQALETWWDATNPMPELAGLHALAERVLALPSDVLTAEQRTFTQSLRAKLPQLPVHDIDGEPALAPASKFDKKVNKENPELYAVFPFRLFAFNRPDAHLAHHALKHRGDAGFFGWRQDDIFIAYLGLTEAARTAVVKRAITEAQVEHFPPPNIKANKSRFPVFWGPNYDWIPDQDHGGIFLKVVQSMLLQTDGRQIFLFPAWPKDWNVEFRLHAPHQTVLTGRLKDGKLEEFAVMPPSREADVTVMIE